jgi:hypothetical protein
MQLLRSFKCFFSAQIIDKHHFMLKLNNSYIAFYASQYTKYKGIISFISEKKGWKMSSLLRAFILFLHYNQRLVVNL